MAAIDAVRRVATFTEERHNRLARFVRVVAAYRSGRPVDLIARDYGCTRGTVVRYAKMVGLSRGQSLVRTTAETRAEVVKLYLAGAPIKEIARQCDVSEAYVSRTATEEKINRRKFTKKEKLR